MKWPSMERECTLHAHSANCYCLKFSPNGEYVLCCLSSRWYTHTDNSQQQHSYFAVGGADALVSLWDAKEFACIRTFGRLAWPIRTVGFSHDGKLLASASEDLMIDIVSTRTLSLKCKHSSAHLFPLFAGGGWDRRDGAPASGQWGNQHDGMAPEGVLVGLCRSSQRERQAPTGCGQHMLVGTAWGYLKKTT